MENAKRQRSNDGRVADDDDGSSESIEFEWVIPNFSSLGAEVQVSEEFGAGFHTWCLMCYPKQNDAPRTHMSLFLRCAQAAFIPKHKAPRADYKLTLLNHQSREQDIRKELSQKFSSSQEDWGFSQMVPLTQMTVGAGYLRSDGAAVVALHLNVTCSNLKLRPRRGVGADLLTLLDQPDDPTADITLTADGKAFRAHRAILAARSAYFRTRFTAGFPDSTAAEVALPEADPDALALLLRFMYGGVLEVCPRPLLCPAALLADRLQLSDACRLVCGVLAATCTARTVLKDLELVWTVASASGGDGGGGAAENEADGGVAASAAGAACEGGIGAAVADGTGGGGTSEALEALEAFYVAHAEKVNPRDVTALAMAHPELMARLAVALAKRAALAPQAPGEDVGVRC